MARGKKKETTPKNSTKRNIKEEAISIKEETLVDNASSVIEETKGGETFSKDMVEEDVTEMTEMEIEEIAQATEEEVKEEKTVEETVQKENKTVQDKPNNTAINNMFGFTWNGVEYDY